MARKIRKKVKGFWDYTLQIFVALMIAVGSWSVFSLARLGMEDFLLLFGITQEWKLYTAMAVIALVVVSLRYRKDIFGALKRLV